MPIVPGTFYGHVRRTAFNLWLGPDYVENVEKEDEDHPLGGYHVLHLAIRKGETAKPRIESRAVYALLIPEPQDALLRALYWDNKTIIHTTHSTPLDTPFKIAVKFVHLPLTLLHGWLALLENIPTTIQITSSEDEDDTLPICTLRVETAFVSNRFERTWVVVEGKDQELNRVWRELWEQMGQVLQTSPALTDIQESFYRTEPRPEVYDHHAYQPTLGLP